MRSEAQLRVETLNAHGKFVGLYRSPFGHKALVTAPAQTEAAALNAAEKCVRAGEAEDAAKGPKKVFRWQSHPHHDGLFLVFSEGALGDLSPVPLEPTN